MPVIREGLRVWFWPTPRLFLHSSHPSSAPCLTTPQLPNQYHRAPGSTGDSSASQPACPPPPLCSFLSPLPQSLSLLSSQQDTTSVRALATTQCQASEGSGWKCDDNTMETKMPAEERKKERGWGKNEKECLDLWTDCLCDLRGPQSCLLMSIMERR